MFSISEDWVQVNIESVDTREEARALEQHIKKRGAARYLREKEASQSRVSAGQG
jgi:hypothetical protein